MNAGSVVQQRPTGSTIFWLFIEMIFSRKITIFLDKSQQDPADAASCAGRASTAFLWLPVQFSKKKNIKRFQIQIAESFSLFFIVSFFFCRGSWKGVHIDQKDTRMLVCKTMQQMEQTSKGHERVCMRSSGLFHRNPGYFQSNACKDSQRGISLAQSTS